MTDCALRLLVCPILLLCGIGSRPVDSASSVSPSAFPPPLRLLYVPLTLRPERADRDAAIIDALRAPGLSWFTHVIVNVPSWPEQPDATEHYLVKHALNVCRARDLPVIWGRNLWTTWPDLVSGPPLPTAESHYDPAFYASAIATLKAEARRIGAAGTFFDAEPYGNGAQVPLKRAVLNSAVQARMRWAANLAVGAAGPVDFIYPSSSSAPTRYVWPLTVLGISRCDAKTYYTKGPGYKLPKIEPPPSYEHRLDLWGANVGRPGDHHNGQPKLSIDDVLALDLDLIQLIHPECRGLWVYIDADIFPQILRDWPPAPRQGPD